RTADRARAPARPPARPLRAAAAVRRPPAAAARPRAARLHRPRRDAVRPRVVPVPDAPPRRAAGEPAVPRSEPGEAVTTAAVLQRIRIHGYRGARDVPFEPGPLCALVGEA